MKKWNFTVKENPKELSKKMKSEFGSVKGLVFSMDQLKNNSITFKIRKRILYPWYLFFQNSLVVNVNLSRIQTENEAKIEISFNQHWLWTLVIATNIIVGLFFWITVFSGTNKNPWIYVIGGVILGIGIILWFRIRKKYNSDVQEYKTLISGIINNS